MVSIPDSSVTIQTSSQSVPSTPSWFGEVTLVAQYLKHLGVLSALEDQVRFARSRFGHDDTIDFLVVLFGYAISGERTLKAFYERVHPFATQFMALFGRDRLPHRSTLSRFLEALEPAAVEALREVFLKDVLSRPLEKEGQAGGVWDREGTRWMVFDVDATRQAARQRALPQTEDRPAAKRRMSQVCAAGYTGGIRGEGVRTRTLVLQAHTSQYLGTFSGAGNGDYRGELGRAKSVGSRLHEGLLASAEPSAAAPRRSDRQWSHCGRREPDALSSCEARTTICWICQRSKLAYKLAPMRS